MPRKYSPSSSSRRSSSSRSRRSSGLCSRPSTSAAAASASSQLRNPAAAGRDPPDRPLSFPVDYDAGKEADVRSESEIEAAVELVWQGHAHGVVDGDRLAGKLDLHDGLRVQVGVMRRHLLRGEKLAGWKVGM